MGYRIFPDGRLKGDRVPDGFRALILEPEEMLPCVGQGAIGIETRANDSEVAEICDRLNHTNTQQCVLAERTFLRVLGGGCQSPVGAYAHVLGHQLRLRAVVFEGEKMTRVEGKRTLKEGAALGEELAARVQRGSREGNS